MAFIYDCCRTGCAESQLFDVSERGCSRLQKLKRSALRGVPWHHECRRLLGVGFSLVGLLVFWFIVILQLSFCASECVWGAMLESSGSGTLLAV